MRGHCKHFNGIGRKLSCKKGINVRKHVGGDDFGWATRMPCSKRNKNPVPCDQYEDYTEEELQAIEDEFKEMENNCQQLEPIIVEIKKKYKEKKLERHN